MLHIDNLRKIVHKISINQLIGIFINHQIKFHELVIIPVVEETASKSSSIIDLYKENNIIYVKVNIFRIKVFSTLEDNSSKYLINEQHNLQIAFEYGVKSLLNKYVLLSEAYILFKNKNLYNLNYFRSIDIIVNNIYKSLREQYCLFVNYNLVNQEIYSPPSIVGKCYINDIYLGETVTTDYYLIDIKILLPSFKRNKKNIEFIHSKIQVVLDSYNFIKCKIRINISETDISTKEKVKYIGNTFIGSISS